MRKFRLLLAIVGVTLLLWFINRALRRERTVWKEVLAVGLIAWVSVLLGRLEES